jgi:hypothetical protein
VNGNCEHLAAPYCFCFLVKVYGLKFTSCATIKANDIQGRVSHNNNRIARKVKQQLSERDKMVAELRNNPDVMKAMRYDIAIYQKAVQIFNQQRAAMKS